MGPSAPFLGNITMITSNLAPPGLNLARVTGKFTIQWGHGPHVMGNITSNCRQL